MRRLLSAFISATNAVICVFSSLHHFLTGMKRNPAWMETFSVQFLGSVEVPHHQGNGILCAAMQKVSNDSKKKKKKKVP